MDYDTDNFTNDASYANVNEKHNKLEKERLNSENEVDDCIELEGQGPLSVQGFSFRILRKFLTYR